MNPDELNEHQISMWSITGFSWLPPVPTDNSIEASLSPAQRVFVAELRAGRTRLEAACTAWSVNGERSALAMANRALRNPKIAQLFGIRKTPLGECIPAKARGPMQTYFIESPKLRAIKIGRSTRVSDRFKCIQTGNPDARLLHVLDGDVEYELHQRFSAHRTSGEWFTAQPIIDFLRSLQTVENNEESEQAKYASNTV